MECDICGKQYGSRAPFHCTTCARSAIYPHRIDQAQTLLDKENLARHVAAIVEGKSEKFSEPFTLEGGSLIDPRESAKAVEVEQARSETEDLKHRVASITEKSEELRKAIEEGKRELAAHKAAMEQRKSDLASATHAIETRRTNDLEKIQRSIKRVGYKWERTHEDTVHARTFLCREAANLAGLKNRRRKSRNGEVKDEYFVGGVPIIDLRDLNNTSPAQVSTSLSNLARLLVLVSSYLSVRLPAEITLQHKEYPLPTIFSPASSYISREVRFPGSTPSHSSNNSPSASRTLEKRPLPRPRPLFLDRDLPKLAKEDPSAYAVFIEGVTLLAWDIAWLCRTQGMRGEFDRWEEICPMGRNLWYLLVASQAPQMKRESSSNNVSSKIASSKSASARQNLALGHFSHGTAHSFLNGPDGTDWLGKWKFQSPARLTDKVKSNLLAEMQGAEWEVLDEKEWDLGEGGVEEEPVMVGARAKFTAKNNDARSTLSSRTAATSVDGDGDRTQARSAGTKGWTKVKSRSGTGDVAAAAGSK